MKHYLPVSSFRFNKVKNENLVNVFEASKPLLNEELRTFHFQHHDYNDSLLYSYPPSYLLVSELFCCFFLWIKCNLPRKPPTDYFQFEFFFLTQHSRAHDLKWKEIRKSSKDPILYFCSIFHYYSMWRDRSLTGIGCISALSKSHVIKMRRSCLPADAQKSTKIHSLAALSVS